MNEAAETKVCPFCAETIRAAAKVCPYCQHRQSRFSILGKDLLTIVTGLVLIGFWVATGVWAESNFNPSERSFAAHRDELEVLRVSLKHARQTPDTWLSALETNTAEQIFLTNYATAPGGPGGFTKIPANLEVRFVDSDGNLLDKHEAETGIISVEPECWLSGFITNRGTKPWNVGELEIRVFDLKTNLVGVQYLTLHESIRAEPHMEMAFREFFNRPMPTNSEVFYRVRVQEANDANAR